MVVVPISYQRKESGWPMTGNNWEPNNHTDGFRKIRIIRKLLTPHEIGIFEMKRFLLMFAIFGSYFLRFQIPGVCSSVMHKVLALSLEGMFNAELKNFGTAVLIREYKDIGNAESLHCTCFLLVLFVCILRIVFYHICIERFYWSHPFLLGWDIVFIIERRFHFI